MKKNYLKKGEIEFKIDGFRMKIKTPMVEGSRLSKII